MENGLWISDNLKDKMLAYAFDVFGKIISPKYNIIDFTNVHFDRDKGKKMIEYGSSYLHIGREHKILDAGCGGGLSVAGMNKFGYLAFGYEIDERVFLIAQQLFRENNLDESVISLVLADYGRLPYADNTFDIIFSNFVLEHVKDPVHYLSELRRILKNDGKLIVLCPNYLVPYETHYGLPFVPFSKSLSRKILLWAKRDQTMFLSFSFPTPKLLTKWIDEAGLKGENMSIKYSTNFIQGIDYSGRSELAISMVRLAKSLHLTSLINYFVKLGFYNPLFFILRKA